MKLQRRQKMKNEKNPQIKKKAKKSKNDIKTVL